MSVVSLQEDERKRKKRGKEERVYLRSRANRYRWGMAKASLAVSLISARAPVWCVNRPMEAGLFP